jgi:hypothetical protein
MKLMSFLKSPTGNFVIFLGFVVVGGLLIHRGNLRSKAQAEQMTKIEERAEPPGTVASFVRNAVPFKTTPPVPVATKANEPAIPGDVDSSSVLKDKAKAAKPAVLPISLFSADHAAQDGTELSKAYAPYGRLIPCETVITLESSKLETPVIGLVTEDVWHGGRLIIPAGAEVHGRASLDRSRERIAAEGKWVFVWRDETQMNGTELVLSGIALDREKNDFTGEFGLRDGSAGLVGTLIRTDNLAEIKLFASTFLAGMASGFQQLQTETTPFGVTQISAGTARDAALQGTSGVLNAYARQIQETIERDGFFVRVPAGKQFYLYVTQTIDQASGTRGNRSNEAIWRKANEN